MPNLKVKCKKCGALSTLVLDEETGKVKIVDVQEGKLPDDGKPTKLTAGDKLKKFFTEDDDIWAEDENDKDDKKDDK